MNWVGLVLDICMYPFVLLMYFLLKSEAASKKGIYYGVTLTGEQAKAIEVAEIDKQYQKQMRLLLWIMLLAPLPMLFLPWISLFMTGWLLWMLASVVCFFIPFGRANIKLKAIKREKGWNREEPVLVLAEIKSAGEIRRVKWYQFLPPCAVSVAICVWALWLYRDDRMEAMSILVGSFTAITFLFWAVAAWTDRQKTEIISTDSEVNINYARAKKNLWKNLWVACAWVNTIYMGSLLFALDVRVKLTGVFIAATILYIFLTLFLAYRMLRKKRQLDAVYRDKMDVVPADEDDYWIWGMCYYNPKDKHSMVEKRVGIGTTMNMATVGGKLLAAFCSIWILIIPMVCIWLILLEFVPIELTVTNDRLVATQIGEDYSIPVIIVEDLELLTELPKWSKVNGTGMDVLQKGTFRVPEEGKCQVFVNPQNGLFIRFEAAGTTYYMSGVDDAQTMEIYELLKE